MNYIFTLLLFLSPLTAFNFSISNSTITNGRTAIILFDKEKDIKLDKIVMGKRGYRVFNHPTQSDKRYALLPVSYYQEPSMNKVKVLYTKEGEELSETLFF